jgi:hypothetical protein
MPIKTYNFSYVAVVYGGIRFLEFQFTFDVHVSPQNGLT